MARTWGGLEHRLIATTHVGSSWVRAVHLVTVDKSPRAQELARRVQHPDDTPVQVDDPFFALHLLKSLAMFKPGKAIPWAFKLLQAMQEPPADVRRQVAATPGTGVHTAVSFIHGPTCMYPFMDQRDYDLLRSAPSVGKAFHAHYYRKGRGLAYYQISAEAATSAIF